MKSQPKLKKVGRRGSSFEFNHEQFPWSVPGEVSSSRSSDEVAIPPMILENAISELQNLISSPSSSRNAVTEADDETKRYCWVCFATDEDDLLAQWVQPCRCRGTTKWVHQACIQRWIDEKQKGNTAAKVSCPQCNTEYIIFYPRLGSLVIIMDSVDALISRVCPFVAAGIVVGSIYWTAVTYGAVTVMQVAGHKEGLSVMEQADPLVLLVGLPTIPVMLILGKMVRWEDQVLRFIRKHSWKIPLLRHILPSHSQPSIVGRVSQDLPALSDPVSATRILCGALLLPTVATVLGKVLFENVRSNFRRAILGGVAFITIKGVLRIYHKQQQYIRQSERKIVDFTEPPPQPENLASGDATPQHSYNNRGIIRPLPTSSSLNFSNPSNILAQASAANNSSSAGLSS
ncbi:unnamed protein product [Allacma fusca]|uniref:E3 ubiquitin-protein ligase MARCHF5 n=1 Tax=Allacma fusca TaxID=39272 RepID=A0A8J2J8B4_9HEXA|nr:unnamed protein product [Allacma fusca]